MSSPAFRPSPEDVVIAPSEAASQRLFTGGCLALAALCFYLVYRAGGEVTVDTLYGLLIIVLSALPALRWAQKRRLWFPAFEIGMLTCIAFYAVPLLASHSELAGYSDAVVSEASFYVVTYLAMANLGFSWAARRIEAPLWARESMLPSKALRYVPAGLALNTLYLVVQNFTTLIPGETQGTLRALFFGIGILSTFVITRLWGADRLTFNEKVFAAANLGAQVILLFSQLYLINGISLVALAFISYAATRRRVPWIPLILFAILASLLHLGKPQMRRIYWEERRALPTLTELPGFYSEWIGHSLAMRDLDTRERLDSSSLLQRASLIHMLCLCVERVPTNVPYLAGESYWDIPALFIPRFLWPDKPSSLMSNVRLAIYFNLVDPDAAFSVSIAFGMISEAFVNFGAFGVALLGFGFGVFYRRMAQLSLQTAQFSILGIAMILLTAWSLQVELVLATWLSSLFQAMVACIGLPFVLRRLFG